MPPTRTPMTRPTRASTRPTRLPSAAARPPRAVEPLEQRQLLSGLTATYYDNPDFTGASVTRLDATVNFDWKSGSPDPRIGPDSFSAQWAGQVRAAYSEQYTFTVQADNAARLWVNGQLLVDQWGGNSVNTSGKITLEAGRLNDIILQYREDTGGAKVKLLWSSARQSSQVVPTNVLYPHSMPGDISEPSGATVYARDFGALGNGSTDDAPALQRAIDATPSFGTLILEPRTYRLNKGLIIQKPMNVLGNGGLLLLNTSKFPDNHQITVNSKLGTKSAKWTENVVAGQSTFRPVFAPGTFTVGQWVFLELGQDPYDVNEQHYTALAPVTAVGTNTITLGTSAPYNVNNGAFQHRITTVDSMATQVHVENVKFDHVDGTIADTAIWVAMARNSTFDGISGRANILLNVSDSTNIGLTYANVQLTANHSAAGRVLTTWQSNYVSVENVQAETSADRAVFMVESWSRKTTIRDVDIRWRFTSAPTHAVFHLTGGSSGTFADYIRINNSGPVNLAGSGSQVGDYGFGAVAISGTVRAAPVGIVDDLTVGSKRYTAPIKVTKTVALGSRWIDQRFGLATGTIKTIKVTANNSNSISSVFLLNATGQGAVLKGMQAGVPIILPGMLGSDYPFNDLTESLKSAAIYTPTSVKSGSTLTFEIEYYPASR
jgi:hypothetical protein